MKLVDYTDDRGAAGAALRRVAPQGGNYMLDALAEASADLNKAREGRRAARGVAVSGRGSGVQLPRQAARRRRTRRAGRPLPLRAGGPRAPPTGRAPAAEPTRSTGWRRAAAAAPTRCSPTWRSTARCASCPRPGFRVPAALCECPRPEEAQARAQRREARHQGADSRNSCCRTTRAPALARFRAPP